MEKIIERLNKYETDFDGIRWAISARSKDDTRTNIKCIKVDGGLIVSTDGHRMHCYMTERAIEDGVYEILKDAKDMIVLRSRNDVDYPDYEKFFPRKTHNGIEPLSVPSESKRAWNGGVDRETAVLNHVLKQASASFNVHYVVDACPADETLFFEQADGNADAVPLIIRNADYTKAALVMPVRI